MQQVLFCTDGSDKIGLEVIEFLGSVGCRVLVLHGEMAPKEAVAVYSEPQPQKWQGDRHSIMAAYRLLAPKAAPKWAKLTPFRAVFRGNDKDLVKAALQLARGYELWLCQRHGQDMPPWGMKPTGHGVEPEPDWQKQFKKWQNWANLVLADCSGWEKTPGLWPLKKKKTRAPRDERKERWDSM